MFDSLASSITKLFDLDQSSHIAHAVNFFIADTIKIFILLAIIIFAVSLLRSYLPPNRIREILAKRNPFIASILAALVGVITPFCTCSAIPLFLGFLEAGVPVGATFSFLIASPMVNEVALIMLLGMFGWKIALLYAGFGLLIAVVSGTILGKVGAEKWIKKIDSDDLPKNMGKKISFTLRLDYAKRYTLQIVKNVWPYILIGIALGATMHGFVPVNYLADIAGKDHWYAIPAAVLLGVPLYSNAAGIVPLISVLTEKGVAIGAVLAFMMSVTGLSFPEFMILRKVLRWQLLLLFFAIVAVSIMVAGYIFNALI